jgi:predicted XRE-type DNA-binding protein
MNRSFGSVWDAIEVSPQAAASMKARAAIMMAVQKTVRGWKLSQHDAAAKLTISQPRLNDLLRGKIDKFSLDALFDLAANAGLCVSVSLKRAA